MNKSKAKRFDNNSSVRKFDENPHEKRFSSNEKTFYLKQNEKSMIDFHKYQGRGNEMFKNLEDLPEYNYHEKLTKKR